MARFVANNVVGSDQLYALSRAFEGHGMWHLGDMGKVTAAGGMILNVGPVPANEYVINGTTISTARAATTATITTAHATKARRDVVYLDNAGAVAVTAGDTTYSGTKPPPPALTSTRLALAEVAVAAGATSLTSGNITDKRQVLTGPRVIRKTATQTINNSATLTNDTVFTFAVGNGETWRCVFKLATVIPTAQGFSWYLTLDTGVSPVSNYWLAYGAVNAGTNTYSLMPAGSTRANIATPGFIVGGLQLECEVAYGGGTVPDYSIARFQWCQQTAGAFNTQILAGSWLEMERVA